MSKNLKKASDWIQRDIDELKEKRAALERESARLGNEATDITLQIQELEEVLEQIPIEPVKSGINAVETHRRAKDQTIDGVELQDGDRIEIPTDELIKALDKPWKLKE